MTARLQAILTEGLSGHLETGELGRVVTACAVHFALVSKWNPTHNLTRVVSEEDAAVHHYPDCALPLVAWAATSAPPASFLDIGSGAGFPGLVASILWPTAQATLVEPAQKRQSFLRVAAGELRLPHLSVIDPKSAQKQKVTASVVLSRATFSEGVRGELWPYVAPGGCLLAWTTAADVSTWEKETKTWPSARGTWNPYALPTPTPAETAASSPTTLAPPSNPPANSPPPKSLPAVSSASSSASSGPLQHGIFEIRRG